MKTEESLQVIFNKINDVTCHCRVISNQCVSQLLYGIIVERKSVEVTLSEESFLIGLRKLAIQICRIDRLQVVEYGMTLLTFPIHSFLEKEDYETVEVFLQEYLSDLSLSILPEQILLCDEN